MNTPKFHVPEVLVPKKCKLCGAPTRMKYRGTGFTLYCDQCSARNVGLLLTLRDKVTKLESDVDLITRVMMELHPGVRLSNLN